jgi:hypothetical protein
VEAQRREVADRDLSLELYSMISAHRLDDLMTLEVALVALLVCRVHRKYGVPVSICASMMRFISCRGDLLSVPPSRS